MEQIELLVKALEETGNCVHPRMMALFSEYLHLLLVWNQRVNLISRRDEARIVTRHFLESVGLLRAVTFAHGACVMDLGSGAGFPGIPMKLVRPDLRFVLVESKRKKVLFLRRVVETLGLEGIDVVQARVEEVGDRIELFDFVVSRSVTDLVTLSAWALPCLKPSGGQLVVIKGPNVEAELGLLERKISDLGIRGWRREKYNPFPSVFELRESYVVVIEKA